MNLWKTNFTQLLLSNHDPWNLWCNTNIKFQFEKGVSITCFPTIDLQNVNVKYDDGYILICNDVYYKGGKIKPSIESLQELSSTTLL
jgi:hypothetical protein